MPGPNPGRGCSEGTGARHPPCQRPGLPCALLPLARGLGAGQRAELSSACGTDDGHPASSFPGPPPPGGSACFLLRAPGFHCERFFGEAASLHSVLLIRFSQVPSVTGLLIFIWSTPDMIRSVGLGGWGGMGAASPSPLPLLPLPIPRPSRPLRSLSPLPPGAPQLLSRGPPPSAPLPAPLHPRAGPAGVGGDPHAEKRPAGCEIKRNSNKAPSAENVTELDGSALFPVEWVLVDYF